MRRPDNNIKSQPNLILGIGPGLRNTGWGVIKATDNRLSYVACGILSSNSKDSLTERLLSLHKQLIEVIQIYRPQTCAIEETFVNKNAQSSLKLGHARGALMLTLSISGLVPHEYAATLVKKSIVGVGRAEKEQVTMMVKQLLPGADIPSHDAADALAIAICHSNHHATLQQWSNTWSENYEALLTL